LLLWAVSSIASFSALFPAAADLKVVQLITSAMRAADLAVAAEAHPFIHNRQDCCELRHECLDPVIEPRVHIYPPPVIEPRQVIHLQPRIQPPPPNPKSIGPSCPRPTELYPPPIWKFLPWPQHVPVQNRVKRLTTHPDILIKGLLIDLFV
jgi:hypothetical protein